jgi:hypothetical protein
MWLFPTVAKSAKALSWRHYVPLSFVSSLFASSIINPFFPSSWALLSGILGIYLLFCLIFSVTAAVKYRWFFVFSLTVVFFILHFSYGIGSLVGLFYSIFHIDLSKMTKNR